MPRKKKEVVTEQEMVNEIIAPPKVRRYDECPHCGQKGSVKPRPRGLIGYFCFGCNDTWDVRPNEIHNVNQDTNQYGV